MEQRRQGSSSEDNLLALAEVARLYYVEDLTQGEIASRTGISRSGVSRMLKQARAHGMVEIRIHSPLRTERLLQEEIAGRLDLRECRVLAKADRISQTFEGGPGRVSDLGASYLQESLADGSVVGLGWSTSVYRAVHSRFLREKRGMTVVQMMGSVGGLVPGLDGVAHLAEVLGAEAHYLSAPVLVTDTAVRDGLLRDPHIRKTLEVARRADAMVTGVGTMDANHGQYRTGYLSDADLEYIRGKGAVGDICGSYYSWEGDLVPVEMNERTIAVSAADMECIPDRIGISAGENKALANVGAARAGLLNVLITDEETAREMLNLLDEG